MELSGGIKEGEIVVGNAYDKYGSKNPIVRKIMKGFNDNLSSLVAKVKPVSIHEVGCGEGYWTLKWINQKFEVQGTDFSKKIITLAQNNALKQSVSPDIFTVKSIYELNSDDHHADLVVCCEVLEHLDHPETGLKVLQSIVGRHLIISVPREPIWRILNVVGGRYLLSLGNTPGHIQHWSKRSLVQLIEKYFDVIEIRTPLPWIMLLCRPLM